MTHFFRVLFGSALFVVSMAVGPCKGCSLYADLVTVPFTGIITDVLDTSSPSGNVGGIIVGSSFSGSFSYDTLLGTDLNPDSNIGLYLQSGIVAYDILVGGVQFQGVLGQNSAVEVNNDQANFLGASVDGISVSQQILDPPGWTSSSPFGILAVGLFDTTASTFVDDSLPTSIDLSDFDFGFVEIRYLNSVSFPGGSDSNVHIIGSISLGQAIPEPCMPVWLLIVSASVRYSQRRCRG